MRPSLVGAIRSILRLLSVVMGSSTAVTAAHVDWLLERRHPPPFFGDWLRGIWQSLWWAVVTVATAGYGDNPLPVKELHRSINEPEDLHGKRVACWKADRGMPWSIWRTGTAA